MDVLDTYNQIASRLNLPTMQQGGYEAESEYLNEPDAVWETLSSYRPAQGWLQFQSRQLIFLDGLPEPEPDWGLLLAAEAVCADDEALSVTQAGAGGWLLTRYRHQDEGTLLWDVIEQLVHDPKAGHLRYRRYWRHEPEQGYVQERACFVGFDGGED